MEMSGALTKVLPRQCRGNTRGLLYIGKKGCDEKIAGCGGGGGGGGGAVPSREILEVCFI